VEAFNSGDWERVRAGLASDSRYDELGTERKTDGPEKIVELFKGWKQAFPNAAGRHYFDSLTLLEQIGAQPK
jgi:hypothetical protein